VHIFLWEAGTVVDLTDLSGAYYASFADDGSVIAALDDGTDVIYRAETGIFEPYEQPDLPRVDPPPGFAEAEVSGINRRGEIAGTVYPVSVDDVQGVRGFVAPDGDLIVLEPAPGGDTSVTWAINDAGQVLGGPVENYDDEDGRLYMDGQAFLYDLRTGETTDLGTLPEFDGSAPRAVNNVGEVVGDAWRRQANGSFATRAFLYDPSTATMVDLNDLILGESGWVLTSASYINDAGQIVGQGMVGGSNQAFLLNPQPRDLKP
jgi:probable HAF family extracellular repeat protein